MNQRDLRERLERIREQLTTGEFRVTEHAQQEMVAEGISLEKVIQALFPVRYSRTTQSIDAGHVA